MIFPPHKALTLSQLTDLVARSINVQPALKNVWVVAETSDLRVSGGHCYMELVEKDPASGKPTAKLKGVIWASDYQRIGYEFYSSTGLRIASDLKIMCLLTVTYHPLYGLSAVIREIDGNYTLGERARKRREILERLSKEGIAEMNRTLPLPEPILRVAVISSKGAAGFGDFIHQLLGGRMCLNFKVSLFEAVMQGKATSRSVISALEKIALQEESFDIVAIIRGGGAVSDLDSFDDYELALNVAQFPLPVIIGIGHERDSTVLDEIAAVSVKTPTAAAEWLVEQASKSLQKILCLGRDIRLLCFQRLSTENRKLDMFAANLPLLATNRINSLKTFLDKLSQLTIDKTTRQLAKEKQLIENLDRLIAALSPESILRRGYSITRAAGKVLTDAKSISPGEFLETVLAHGKVISQTIAIPDKS